MGKLQQESPGLRFGGALLTLLMFHPAVFARTPGATEVRTEAAGSSATAGDRALDAASGLLERGLFDLAEAEFRTALAGELSPDRRHAAEYGLALCLHRLGRPADAIDLLKPLAGDEHFPYAADAGVMLGRSLLLTGAPAEAAGTFAGVARTFPQHALAEDALAGEVEALYRAGDRVACRRRGPAALEKLKRPELRQRTRYILAVAALTEGEPAVAADELRALLSDKPEGGMLASAQVRLGECLAAQGDDAAALAQFTEALAGDAGPESAAAEMGAAEALFRLDRAAEADARVERVVRTSPPAAMAARAQRLRGHLRFAAGDYAAARTAFEAALAAAPDDTDIPYWIAKCRLRSGETAPAAELFATYAKAHGDGPLAPAAVFDSAVAYLDGERVDEARAALSALLERYPQDRLVADALQLSAVAAYRAGDDAAVARHSSELLERFPEHPLAVDAWRLAIESAFRAEHWPEVLQLVERGRPRYASTERWAEAAYRAGLAACRLEQSADAGRYLAEVSTNGEIPERFAPAALALGDIGFQQADWASAEKWLTQYLASAERPQAGDEALLKRGIARARLERQADAVADFAALAAQWPQSPLVTRAQFERGQALLKLGDAGAAEAAFASAGTNGIDGGVGSLAAYQQGVLAMAAGDYPRASAHFTRVIEIADSPDRCGEALFQRGQCRLAMGDAPAADADFAALIERQPQHRRVPAGRAWRVVAAARQNQPQAALAALAKISAEEIANLDGRTRAALLLERAGALRETQQVDAAQAAYAELLALPELDGATRAHGELAAAELAIGRDGCAAARERLARLADTSDTPAAVRERALYRLGLCALAAEQWTEAEERLNALLSDYPNATCRASALLHAGEAALRLGAHARALPRLEEVLAADTAAPERATARLRMGECLAGMQRWVESERVLQALLDAEPGGDRWFEAQFGIGWSRENQERRKEAIEAYAVVVERHQGPTAARAQFQIGECRFAEGELEAAVRELLKVDILYAYPEWSAAALYEAGRCFEQMNRRAEAREQFEAVIARFKDSPWARSAEQRLPLLATNVPGH